MSGKKKPRYKTFRLMDRTGTIQHPLIVVGESFESYRVVYQERYQFQDRVTDGTTLMAHIGENEEAARKAGLIYYRQSSAPELLASIIERLRTIALQGEASPEAIRLLDTVEPWSEKEKKIMAEKLKAKAANVKTADKEGLKAAAKSAPVAKKGGGARKGNPDALAKARAARAERGPDNRKVKPLIKAKDIAARAGSYRHTMLTNLINAKTVQEFRDKGHTAGDLAYATKAGIVSVA
jgi:hypothetical protein